MKEYKCVKCEGIKHHDEMVRHPKGTDGITTICIKCKGLYQNEYRKKQKIKKIKSSIYIPFDEMWQIL